MVFLCKKVIDTVLSLCYTNFCLQGGWVRKGENITCIPLDHCPLMTLVRCLESVVIGLSSHIRFAMSELFSVVVARWRVYATLFSERRVNF